MSVAIDSIMEEASAALVKMDYLTCEDLCQKALAEARAGHDWAYYARVLLPLQESRRQRRMIAADGDVRLGTAGLAPPASAWVAGRRAGCIIVTDPHAEHEARALVAAAAADKRWFEVLLADTRDGNRWTVRSFAGPSVKIAIDAPPSAWINRWVDAGHINAEASRPCFQGGPPSIASQPGSPRHPRGQKRPPSNPARTPADYFLDAAEKLGQAALDGVTATRGSDRLAQLETCLAVVTDHENIHQALWRTAHDLSQG